MPKTEFTKRDLLDLLKIGDIIEIYAEECSPELADDDVLTESDVVRILRCARIRERRARQSLGKFVLGECETK